MFAGRDSTCPGSDYNIEVPMSGCISSTGWRYTGPASYRVLDFEDETTIILNADSHITTASDETMIAVGTYVHSNRTVDGASVQAVEMRGMLGYPPADTSWLQETMSADLNAVWADEDGGTRLDVTGGWSHGENAITFHIDTPPSCELLTGSVGMRDPSGFWHAIALDCSNCGTWTYGDQEQPTELCIDVPAFRAWLDAMGER
jgi:hypothetical protein